MRPRSVALALSLGLGVALASAATSAAAAPREDAAALDAAKARYAEGLRLYKRKRYEEARAAFLQANALRHHPMTTLMLAESALKSGRWLEAARGFDAYAAEVEEPSPKVAELVAEGRREARSHLGRIRLDVPAGSEVTVDGEPLKPPAPGAEPTLVMPGVHAVAVTQGGQTKTEAVDVAAGRTVDVHPSFAPKALVPDETTRIRPTPVPRPPAERAEAEGAHPSLLAPPATTWPVYAAGAIGLSGLAVAAIAGGLEANASHAIDVATQTLTRNGKSPSSCDTGSGWATASGQNEADERAKYAAACGTIRRNQGFLHDSGSVFGPALVAGIAGTTLAAGWFFLAPKEPAGDSGRDKPPAGPALGPVTPWIAPSGAGATVGGTFE
jgi:hypothetical protein